jgi:hypothetical protein
VPCLVVSLDLKGCFLAPISPLLHFFRSDPASELKLDDSGGSVFLDDLCFSFELHKEVLLGQVLNFPLRRVNSVVLKVEISDIAALFK